MAARTRFDYAEQLPTIGLNADYARSEFADTPEADQRELFLEAQQEIVRYGATTPSRFAAKHQEQAEKARYREAIIAVDSQVRQAYYRLLLTRDEIASRDELLAYFRAKMDRVQTRLDAGLARPVELHEAELEVLEEQTRINNLQRELRTLHLKLFTEIGLVGKRSLRDIEVVGPALRATPATRPQRSGPVRPHRGSPRQPARPRRTRLANRPTATPSAQCFLAVAAPRRPATDQGFPRHRPRLELERQRPNLEAGRIRPSLARQ